MKMKLFLISYFFFAFSQLLAHQVIILGSGPAGLTAAIYASRAGLSTLLIEGEEPGGQIALSYMVDNFPGFPHGINGYVLGENMREQALRFGTKIQTGRVTEANLAQHPFTFKLEDGEEISADAVIVASGASAKWLGLDSEKVLTGKGVSSCATCDGPFFKEQEVVVVGGGDTALEDALFLARYAAKVTVVHRRNTLKASKYLQNKVSLQANIHFIWDSIVTDILNPQEEQVTGVIVKNLNDQSQQFCPCQGVFIAIGHTPNTDLFKGQLELNEAGYIQTKPFSTQTNIPGVFAAGDVADPRYQQAITAAASGCMAAMDVDHFIQQLDYEEP